jgi:2-dehydro-3-deoxyphosphogluconate aldolase/(4S)-4-hydroxy-2-oxoglutarate aldolase
MIPTGGVNLITAAQFLAAGACALGIGGDLISASALERGAPEEITEAARQYVAVVRGRLAA